MQLLIAAKPPVLSMLPPGKHKGRKKSVFARLRWSLFLVVQCPFAPLNLNVLVTVVRKKNFVSSKLATQDKKVAFTSP